MAKAKTKKEPKTKKPKVVKTKPTAEQLSDQQRQTLMFSYKRKLKPLLAAEKEAKTDVSQTFEQAKKEGIPKKEILLAIQLESDEGIEKMKAEVERTHRIARWLGVGKQLDLFGAAEKQVSAERNFEDGRIAALNDLPAKPPGHLSQQAADTWLQGHAAGRTSLNTERASSGFKPLSEVVSDLIPDPPPMPANGNAEHVAH